MDAICESLLQMYGQVDVHASSLGVVTLPPFEPDVMRWLAFTGVLEKTEATRQQVNAFVRAEASRRQTAFLVDLAALAHEPVFHRPDGLHFEEGGYPRLGSAAAEALRRHYM